MDFYFYFFSFVSLFYPIHVQPLLRLREGKCVGPDQQRRDEIYDERSKLSSCQAHMRVPRKRDNRSGLLCKPDNRQSESGMAIHIFVVDRIFFEWRSTRGGTTIRKRWVGSASNGCRVSVAIADGRRVVNETPRISWNSWQRFLVRNGRLEAGNGRFELPVENQRHDVDAVSYTSPTPISSL